MPTITTSIEELEFLLRQKLTPKLLEKILLRTKAEIKHQEGKELKIEVKDTNRPDLWCAEGIIREFKENIEIQEMFKRRSNLKIYVEKGVKNIRPYIGGILVKGIKITTQLLKSLIEVQERLSFNYGRRRKFVAIGMYNGGKISFPIFYKAVPPDGKKFTPLEFDEPLTLEEILKKHPKGREYEFLLAGKKEFPFIEDSKGTPLSFPPIINSKEVGEVKVGDDVLFCEVTGEKLEDVILIINILALNFNDRGGKVFPCVVHYPYPTSLGNKIKTPYHFDQKMCIPLTYIKKTLGINLSTSTIVEHLKKSHYTVKVKQEKLNITLPPYRRDIMHWRDVVEDCAISIGYQTFKPKKLTQFTVGRMLELEEYIQLVSKVMIGAGFEEVMTNTLTSGENLFEKMQTPTHNVIEIKNPISKTHTLLRDSLIPSLLEVECLSSKSYYPHKIFEISEIVLPDQPTETESKTQSSFASLIAHPTANFSELQSVLSTVGYYIGLNYCLKKTSHPSFIEGRVGEILLLPSKFPVGIIGEIHPEVLENWRIKYPTVVFEIYNLNLVYKFRKYSWG